MIEHSIPAGRMYRAPDMLADPHFAAREAIIDAVSPAVGPFKMQNAFPKLSETPSSIRSLAPVLVGEHNEEILGGLLGMSEEQRAQLAEIGAI